MHPYLTEGVGEDFWPATFDRTMVDRWVTVSDKDAFLTTRRLAETEGILAGGSGGMAVHAALEAAAGIDDPEALVVVILPDGGRSYLSKVFNDTWLQQHGMLEPAGSTLTVGDVLRHIYVSARRCLQVGCDDFRTGCTHRRNRSAADAAAGACHQRDRAVQNSHVVIPH